MDNVVPINSLKEKPPAIDAFVLRSHISKKALEVTNDESYIPFEIDPIGYIEARNKQHISDVLGKLSLTSTRSYIRTFLQCMKYMTNFESKIGNLFMNNGDKKQRIIMAFIYLVHFPKIEQDIYTELKSILDTASNSEILSARNSITRMGVYWTEDEFDDPILAQFLIRASYAENGLRQVA